MNQLTVNSTLNFQNQRLGNIAGGVNPGDAINVSQYDALSNFYLPLTAKINSLDCNGNVDFKSHNLINVSDPINLQDATTKNWIQNVVFQSINTYLLNNSIQIQKLLFSGDGTTFLASDGTYKSISNTPNTLSNVNQIPYTTLSTYNGSLSGVNSRLLILINETSFNESAVITNISNLITSLGG